MDDNDYKHSKLVDIIILIALLLSIFQKILVKNYYTVLSLLVLFVFHLAFYTYRKNKNNS